MKVMLFAVGCKKAEVAEANTDKKPLLFKVPLILIHLIHPIALTLVAVVFIQMKELLVVIPIIPTMKKRMIV